ncbi:tetratricopeptide repeat protein 4 [Ditylenchus destructor]|uniref:Tetratricopeptide repeat protein 4 n=1 Tax=Ditylenchus destructor TaxID=166010 RepID=A0AAD4RDM5_9BILA|nr:tetratricopeptide repeat protein 4 [Ditylenchus destructor]
MKTNSKILTDEERTAMAQKMDDELDKFMDQLAANRTTSGETQRPFDFDEWCKKIDQHPAFMTKLDESAMIDGEYAETLQALQAMKYSTEDDEDLCHTAIQHKGEGNKHFKLKKYRWAVDCYTNGIKVCCDDRKINSVLFSNRAAAQKHLGNLRSSLKDCVFARKFDHTNVKAILRGAECLLDLGYGKQCIEWINSSLAAAQGEKKEAAIFDEKTLSTLEDLQNKAKRLVLAEELNSRQKRMHSAKDSRRKQDLLEAFRERKLRFQPKLQTGENDGELFEWSDLEVQLNQLDKPARTYIDEQKNELIWPLLLQYPEVAQTDYISDCSESTPFSQLLFDVFSVPAPWDNLHEFRMDNVRLFVALDVFDEDEIMEVHFEQCLKEILSHPDVVIVQGLPVIQVYTKKHIKEQVISLGEGKMRIKR